MVSVSLPAHSMLHAEHTDRIDRLLQSIDFAIKELFDSDNSSLALATYLSIFREVEPGLTNAGKLVSWGESWVRQILIDRQTGPRRDEELASACLAAVALIDTQSIQLIRDTIRDQVALILNEELSRQHVPFKHPSYGTIVLLAAKTFGVADTRIAVAASKTAQSFAGAAPRGMLYGLVFCVRLLQQLGLNTELKSLQRALHEALSDIGVSYENHVYLVQALWQLPATSIEEVNVVDVTARALAKSPAWSYLMNGMEDMPPVGDEHTIVKVSHLYRAALLDILMRFQTQKSIEREAAFNAKYKGSLGIGLSAFSLYILIFAAAWYGLISKLLPLANDATQFWLYGKREAMPFSTALLFLFGIAFATYLLPITVEVLRTLFPTLVRSQIQSDRRIRELLWFRLWRVTKWWLGSVLLVIVFGIIVNVISPMFQPARVNK